MFIVLVTEACGQMEGGWVRSAEAAQEGRRRTGLHGHSWKKTQKKTRREKPAAAVWSELDDEFLSKRSAGLHFLEGKVWLIYFHFRNMRFVTAELLIWGINEICCDNVVKSARYHSERSYLFCSSSTAKIVTGTVKNGALKWNNEDVASASFATHPSRDRPEEQRGFYVRRVVAAIDFPSLRFWSFFFEGRCDGGGAQNSRSRCQRDRANQTLWSDSNTICDYSSRTSAASYIFFLHIFLIISSPNSARLFWCTSKFWEY